MRNSIDAFRSNSTQGDADAIRRRLIDKAYIVVISKEE